MLELHPYDICHTGSNWCLKQRSWRAQVILHFLAIFWIVRFDLNNDFMLKF